MAGAADDGGSNVCTQWWFPECPFAATCDHEIWTRRAHRCQSWESEEDARYKLFMHLRWRKEHKTDVEGLDDDGIKELADTVEIDSRTISKDDDEYKQWMKWEKQKKDNKKKAADEVDRAQYGSSGGKRHRGGGDRGGGGRSGGDERSGISMSQSEQIAELVASKLAAGPASGPSAPAAPASPAMALVRLSGSAAVENTQKVTISLGELKALQDDIKRCSRAAGQINRFLDGAKAAFTNEMETFNAADETISQIIEANTAGFVNLGRGR